mmetsp:Transcript_41298/g.89460  ORF Transcript_41298/g.89460 Transcript_41298/m.89460 type:complete len:201 (+) Transcript_41298:1456-2058(+)
MRTTMASPDPASGCCTAVPSRQSGQRPQLRALRGPHLPWKSQPSPRPLRRPWHPCPSCWPSFPYSSHVAPRSWLLPVPASASSGQIANLPGRSASSRPNALPQRPHSPVGALAPCAPPPLHSRGPRHLQECRRACDSECSPRPCQVTGAQYPAPCCRAALTRKTSPWRTWPQGTTAGALRPLQSAVPPDRNTAETQRIIC